MINKIGWKYQENRDLVEDVRRIQPTGLEVQAGFIVGFDSDSPATFQRLADFIQKSGIVTAMVGLLQAPPGTRLYERLKHAGRLLERMSGDNVDGTTNIIPVMNLDALRNGYKNLLQYIYAFIRSVYRLGIVEKERVQYWKLFLWTLFRRPRALPLATTLAIYGYHFRKICELRVL